MKLDVAIVGGGPAGLAAAIAAARRGLATAVFERQALPADKACGEGVMPYGALALDRLGVLAWVDPARRRAFHGVRWVDASGAVAEARLDRPGLGIRRLALSEALLARAQAAGAQVLPRAAVESFEVTPAAVSLRTAQGPVEAKLLVAADGLHSPIRKALGLEVATRGPSRYGLRQHFQVAPWSDCVEVHLSDGVEAYLTPVGEEQLGVAFLWDRATQQESVEAMLARFPGLKRRLAGAEPRSTPRGAGPFLQQVSKVVSDRVVLLGDAAGYVDAITGEGISLALESAELLGALLPAALAAGATEASLAPYAGHHRRAFSRYRRLAEAVLAISRRPTLRRTVISGCARAPSAFSRAVNASLPG